MNHALEKTIVFILLIAAGYLLQSKLKSKQDLAGVKVLILSVILPATIFVALLKINISTTLLLLPAGALILNFTLFYLVRAALPRLGFSDQQAKSRTMLLLLPSLAPGLSCFPFVIEYLGDEALAMAALTDVGNKIFVLIVLYLIAMNWYYATAKKNVTNEETSFGRKAKMKSLGLALLREPVNIVIVIAVLMLSFGLNVTSLPTFLETTVMRLAALMTPIVLLFIGMAVRLERREVTVILRCLAFRASLGLLLSGLLLLFLPAIPPALALLAVIFPQSAVSFWPFAHMSAVEALTGEKGEAVFSTDLALNVLACSLPFSTVIILGVLSCGDVFTAPSMVFGLALLLLSVPLFYMLRPSSQVVAEEETEPESYREKGIVIDG